MSLSASCTQEDCVQFVTDFLEVSIHQILWAKKIYPKEIFQQTQKFNALVYKSIHPEVNIYIENTLHTVKCLLLENFAEKLVLVVKEDGKPTDRFVFCFNSFYKYSSSGKVTLNITELRQQARAIWLIMSHRFIDSEKHDKENCTFAFEIHTRNVAFNKILERQSTEDFQWIEADKIRIPSGVVPIRKLDSQPFCIDVYAEDYREDDF